MFPPRNTRRKGPWAQSAAVDRIEAIMAVVVLLPFEPVMPTILAGQSLQKMFISAVKGTLA